MTDKNLIIFAGNDIVALQFLNEFVPQMIHDGVNPIIMKVHNKPHAFDHIEMQRYAFYDSQLLNNHLIPHLQSYPDKVFKLKTIDQLTAYYNLETQDVKNVNDPEFIAGLSHKDFVGAISIRCFQIFKANIIQAVRAKGFFGNSHPGLLPDYKGVFCLLRAMANGERKVGWTIHHIDEGIDTGRIIEKVEVENNGHDTMYDLFQKSMFGLVDAWTDFIDDYLNDSRSLSQKQTKDGDYYSYPNADDMNRYLSNGPLKPLQAKEIVQHYCELFYAEKDRFSEAAQNFKVLLINKVAAFETMIAMQNEEKPAQKAKDKKAA